MSIDFKNNVKNIRTTSPNYSLFAGGNCPEPYLGQFLLGYIPICNQSSLLSVLLSSSTSRNLNNSRPIYVILLEMRNHCRNIWFMRIQNVSIFLFLEKQPPKRTNSSTCYLVFKGPPFQYHKLRHPNFL